ncbi:hypothetical protein DMJ13_05230 [halophilic archaeon]|nr:hypothetical protein DMJ13_05230 [halophilic archaeon]
MLTKTRSNRRTRREEPVSRTVVQTVAERNDASVTELPPLYDSVDPDALNALVRRGGDDLRITFRFAGRQIVVDGDGTVTVD